jgi:hypothetical protein
MDNREEEEFLDEKLPSAIQGWLAAAWVTMN